MACNFVTKPLPLYDWLQFGSRRAGAYQLYCINLVGDIIVVGRLDVSLRLCHLMIIEALAELWPQKQSLCLLLRLRISLVVVALSRRICNHDCKLEGEMQLIVAKSNPPIGCHLLDDNLSVESAIEQSTTFEVCAIVCLQYK